MSLIPKFSVPTFFLLLALVFLLIMETAGDSSSLAKVLHHHGLPGGLFPQNVKSFNLDQTGRMEVHMHYPCLAHQYESQVFFDSVVRANLSFGQLQVFGGMCREELFLWFPVKDIMVTDPSSGLIIIDIGLAFKRLPLSRFEDPPICISQGN
ncbi:uncharacterized protein LOC130719977 [Lotus japonicus]|uniref:uncharacterized protein LOC130719977 n=1 Tax=Lotus japonicus TaxID=34305 RepID=UPI002590DBCC|nr:uncharacterized protein LOC130719977 [Lotus japonicus]